MPRPGRRPAGLVGGALIMFLVGTNVQAGWLFVLAALLLGTAAAGWLLAGRMVRGLEVERRAPAEVSQGSTAVVELAIRNRARGARFGVVVEDDLVAPTDVEVPTLRPGDRVDVSTVRRAIRRGPQRSTGVVLRSGAPFGIGERRRTATAPAGTLVLPAVVGLPDPSFVEPVGSHERGALPWPRPGTGPEYLGIREYRPGDSPRQVHWPSTARHGSVMVREREEERTGRLAIVIDASADTTVGDDVADDPEARGARDASEAHDDLTPLDACCSAAGSIALATVARGRRARLVAAGLGELDGAGGGDEGRLLRALAHLSAAGGAFSDTLSSLHGAVGDARTVVLVFPTWSSNAGGVLGPAVAALAAMVPRVAVLAVDAGRGPAGDRPPRLTPQGVAELVTTLRNAGADVRLWRSGEDLAGALAPGAPVP